MVPDHRKLGEIGIVMNWIQSASGAKVEIIVGSKVFTKDVTFELCTEGKIGVDKKNKLEEGISDIEKHGRAQNKSGNLYGEVRSLGSKGFRTMLPTNLVGDLVRWPFVVSLHLSPL